MVQVHYGADYCWLSCKWFSFESCGFPRVTRHVVIELSNPSRKEMSIWVHLCNTCFRTYEKVYVHCLTFYIKQKLIEGDVIQCSNSSFCHGSNILCSDFQFKSIVQKKQLLQLRASGVSLCYLECCIYFSIVHDNFNVLSNLM